MNTINAPRVSTAATVGPSFFKIVFIILGLVGLYYLYRYLFQETVKKSQMLIASSKKGDAASLPAFTATSMPALVEGGEYSVSFWIYINNMALHNGRCKHVLSIGSGMVSSTDSTKFETMAVYIGPREPSLHIRTNNSDTPSDMKSSVLLTKFSDSTNQVSEAVMGADVPQIDMQRWVNVTIVMNGRTTDVYIDGKLMRSTINTGIFRVPSGGYQMTVGHNGGFGGYISRLQVFEYALNPEEAYRTYTAGPHGQMSPIDWLRSIFSPSEIEPPSYPV
jgi:hypothetical protein